jgi:hypothetical protein
MARISKPIVKQSFEALEHMRMIIGKSSFGKSDYEDIAITAAGLARQTTNILTRIELHRTAHLSAFAAEMDEMAVSEAKQARALMTAFNRGKELPNWDLREKDPEVAKFENSLAREAKFTHMLRDLRRGDDKSADVVAGIVMMLHSEPEDETVLKKAAAELGSAGLFIRGGQGFLGQRPKL